MVEPKYSENQLTIIKSTVTIDTEYKSIKGVKDSAQYLETGYPISAQLYDSKNCCVFLSDKISPDINNYPRIDFYNNPPIFKYLLTESNRIRIANCIGKESALWFYENGHKYFKFQNMLDLTINFFYSPKDIEYTFGWIYDYLLEKKYFNQQRNFRLRDKTKVLPLLLITENDVGCLVRIRLNDYSSIVPEKGLLEFANTFGVQMEAKHSLDRYKTNMIDAFAENNSSLDAYLRDDVVKLHEAIANILPMFNEVRGLLGLPGWEKLPSLTLGSLVARCLSDFILQYHISIKPTLELLVNTEKKSKSQSANALNFINESSVKGFQGAANSSAYLAVIHGGRCVNEIPEAWSIQNVADVDIAGAYSSVIERSKFPLGVPTIISYSKQELDEEKTLTLKQFLTKYENDLVDGLWFAVISGATTFDFDYLPSIDTTIQKINGSGISTSEFNDTEHTQDAYIKGDRGVFLREVCNGVLTSDSLKTIRAVASNQELGQIMRFKLISAVAYLKHDQCQSFEEWSDKIRKNPGKVSFDTVIRNDKDTRNRSWIGIPLNEFIGELRKERARLKEEHKRTPNPMIGGKEQLLKLIGNTIYGCLVSPYFQISNVVVGNNITASVRDGVWKLAKSLGLRQCITDGGIYDLTEVPTFENRKPSFGRLAKMYSYQDKRYGYTKTLLFSRNWLEEVENKFNLLTSEEDKNLYKIEIGKKLDEEAAKHVKSFWEPYGLNFNFSLEHKIDNLGYSGGYLGKGDYCIHPIFLQEFVTKLRGTKLEQLDLDLTKPGDEVNNKNICGKQQLLRAIATGEPIAYFTEYRQERLIKVPSYNMMSNKLLKPGDCMVTKRHDKLCAANIKFNNRAEQTRYIRQKDRSDAGYEKGQGFKNIDEVLTRMIRDAQQGIFKP